ncbi:MAG: alpha/beta fold hydrolase [Bryobacteraceae bacterium]|nr:alpha/beta fold hydrolase [Bryobacteraceae bacterium]
MIPLLLLFADLRGLEAVMGPLPPSPREAPVVEILNETKLDGGLVRREIVFLGRDQDRVSAYLFLPPKQVLSNKGKRPALLCLHQTTRIGKAEPAGLGGKPDLHYALELARRGYVTLAPDYPNFGGYIFDPYAHGYQSATMKGIANHRRALDVLASLPQVNPKRLGVIGHSLGGHNSLFLAAFDRRVRVTVTSCGFTAFARYYGGNLTGWSHAGYMPRIASVYGKDPARLPFDFHNVLAALAGRALFINAPLHDSNFDVVGVRETVAQVERRFRPGRLRVSYPDTGHEFPPEVREEAYRFLDRHLLQ